MFFDLRNLAQLVILRLRCIALSIPIVTPAQNVSLLFARSSPTTRYPARNARVLSDYVEGWNREIILEKEEREEEKDYCSGQLEPRCTVQRSVSILR